MADRLQINARDIFAQPLDDIWYLNDVDDLLLVMDDGIEEATGRSVLYSWFYWEYNRQVPELPLNCIHHVGKVRMNDKTHLEFLSVVLWSHYDISGGTFPIEELSRIGYEITNTIFNELTIRLEEYVTSSCILDYIEIIEDDYISTVRETAPRTPEGLEEARDNIQTYLRRPDVYPDNALKAHCEAEIVNWGQMLQAVAFRGFATDIDSFFFTDPIMRSYAQGLTKLQDSMQESRSGTKALMSQESPLRQTEYFNRRMQLVTQVLQGKEDIGTDGSIYSPVDGD